jgi:toxin-antitoxin system PIN domain toxin
VQALDTNILVYAEIASSRHHRRALEIVRTLAEGGRPWALPWPCVYEFLRTLTHPRVYHPPVPMEVALGDLTALLGSPSLVLLAETTRHTDVFLATIRQSGATGNLVHDAHIAALCIEHGVSELLTADRDFARFTGIKATNPFD